MSFRQYLRLAGVKEIAATVEFLHGICYGDFSAEVTKIKQVKSGTRRYHATFGP